MQTGLMWKFGIVFILSFPAVVKGQSPEELLRQVRLKLEKVNDYEASGKMKTNVVFIKTPIASVRVYYKKPNKLRINNESGISLIPKGAMNINVNNIFPDNAAFDIIDVGKENGTGLRIIKLLPRNDTAEVVLSTLYIDEQQFLIKKTKTTTKDNGTYELEMFYGKYIAYGLADKIIFSFNTKDYKLPKGVTFDYDDGNTKGKQQEADKVKNRKGKVEITYSSYIINKGVPDSVFR